MINATEDSPTQASERDAMESRLQEVHRRLDEFEEELAADYRAIPSPQARWDNPGSST